MMYFVFYILYMSGVKYVSSFAPARASVVSKINVFPTLYLWFAVVACTSCAPKVNLRIF